MNENNPVFFLDSLCMSIETSLWAWKGPKQEQKQTSKQTPAEGRVAVFEAGFGSNLGFYILKSCSTAVLLLDNL